MIDRWCQSSDLFRHPELSRLVGHWTFEDRIHQKITDESGNGHPLEGMGGLDVDQVIESNGGE